MSFAYPCGWEGLFYLFNWRLPALPATGGKEGVVISQAYKYCCTYTCCHTKQISSTLAISMASSLCSWQSREENSYPHHTSDTVPTKPLSRHHGHILPAPPRFFSPLSLACDTIFYTIHTYRKLWALLNLDYKECQFFYSSLIKTKRLAGVRRFPS